MNKTVALLSVLVMAASLLWASCGKAEKKPVAASQAEAPAVDISTLQEFLRYPGAKATERVQISTDDSKGTAWTLVSDDTRAQVEDWYRASGEKAGWVKDPEGNKVGMLELVNNDRTETIKMMVYEKGGRSYISITHGLK